MDVSQHQWTPESGWLPTLTEAVEGAHLVLVFGGREQLKREGVFAPLLEGSPEACVLGCSTAGEILDTRVRDDTAVATFIRFERAHVQCVHRHISGPEDSESVGKNLGQSLPREGLAHVFVLSNGLAVNGSELVQGLTSNLPADVQVTGGLAGDGARFEETLVLTGEEVRPGAVAALGFYGDSLRFGFGSLGGWDPFGPERTITKSEGNVLLELDEKPALALYKRYLGEHADGLPATGLLFPLSVTAAAGHRPVARTILSVSEEDGSLTFAGDVPEGARARLMKANFDRLVDGAAAAAQTSTDALDGSTAELAILVSCVGRKLVLKQRIEEEVEAVRGVLGDGVALTGFYSYGEISPFTPNARCELHNQTMTITTIREVVG